MIEISGCSKSFSGQCVLDNVSMQIPDGTIMGLLGSSGIGKSTLAKILCGVHTPDTGAVTLDGQTLAAPGKPYARRLGLAVQMVYQQPHASLDPSQKISAGLLELIRYHRLAKGRAEADAMIRALLQEVQLAPEILNHLPRQISGGEAQRAVLARCLLLRPRLLILDEATSMLDVSTQANVLALVRDILPARGGSVLLITHDRTLAEAYCGPICKLDEDHRLKEERL